MNKLVYSLISLALLVFMLIECKRSGSMQPGTPDKDSIKVKGSESELNLISFFANGFSNKHGNISVSAAGGGSGYGIKELLENNADIAISSRPMNEEEQQTAKLRGLVPVSAIVALDAVAIITNTEVGVDSLSLVQLKCIFDGAIKNWKEIGGADMPVKVYVRDHQSGTQFYITERLGIKNYAKGTIIMNENAEIINAIKKEKGAVGYVSLGSLMDNYGKPNPHVWAISTFYEGGKSHSPYEKEAVLSGEYPLIRPLYQYIIGLPKGKLLDFLKFELSNEQQKRIEMHGYFPINQIHRTINQKNIPDLAI